MTQPMIIANRRPPIPPNSGMNGSGIGGSIAYALKSKPPRWLSRNAAPTNRTRPQ